MTRVTVFQSKMRLFMTKDDLSYLTELALKSYLAKMCAKDFAVSAAQIIAKAAAAKVSPTLADDAVFVAATRSCINLSKYSATQANRKKKEEEDRENHFRNEVKAEAAQQVSRADFNALVDKIKSISFGNDADALCKEKYNENQAENYPLAMIAASNVYFIALCSSSVAYTCAIAHSARESSTDDSHIAFKDVFSKVLSSSLLNEPIEPSFFLQIISSDAMKVAGIVLLVAGLAALSLGICALVTAPIGTMLAGIFGLGGLEVTATGSAMAATGGGLLFGRFFSMKNVQDANKKSEMAVHAIHNYDPEKTRVEL